MDLTSSMLTTLHQSFHMNSKGGPFSRMRPKATAKKKPIGFLDFPGEIRNSIYDYFFQGGFKCEFAEMDAKLGQKQRDCLKFVRHQLKPSEVRAISEQRFAPVATIRFSRTLGQYKRIEGLDTRWETSLCGLILVCKQVHTECIGFFYRNTVFAFDAPSRIINFLKVPLVCNLSLVTRIELHYRSYGNPESSKDIRWKVKHCDSWSRTCKAAAKQLINLQQVDIWVRTCETNVRLNVHEAYLKPICWFRQRLNPNKTIAKALTTVNVRIDTIWNRPGAFKDKRLQWASEHLHTLFEDAISRMMLGATVSVAMKDFNHAWEIQYTQWHHHLQFANTGW